MHWRENSMAGLERYPKLPLKERKRRRAARVKQLTKMLLLIRSIIKTLHIRGLMSALKVL